MKIPAVQSRYQSDRSTGCRKFSAADHCGGCRADRQTGIRAWRQSLRVLQTEMKRLQADDAV
jgi:hypothetical protein